MSEDLDHETPRSFPFILGIIGDSGSGKSTVAKGVRALIGPDRVASLELDDYHRYTRAERLALGMTPLNPAVHNLSLMHEHLQLLRRGRPVRNRRYDHSDGSFGPVRILEPREVVIARGLLGFPSDELRASYDLAVFLQPEAELLFRWKLRRDVKTRGYSEAEVLKHIAHHILDAKEYVLPQADRADLVVRYDLPEWDAPDSEVRLTLHLRRAAAEALRSDAALAHFAEYVQLEEGEDGDVVLRVSNELPDALVNERVRIRFPASEAASGVGMYHDDAGATTQCAPLCFVELLIADLTQKLRRTEGVTAGASH